MNIEVNDTDTWDTILGPMKGYVVGITMATQTMHDLGLPKQLDLVLDGLAWNDAGMECVAGLTTDDEHDYEIHTGSERVLIPIADVLNLEVY